jgi:D-alanyl-lipoteichoic acid acyltransferase DltB (MBOAT superfamily)
MNLGTLAYYKYTGFLLTNINAAFGTHVWLGAIVLPLGISFFTFQKIAFLIDTYRGHVRRITLLDFGLFVVFFPQLIAGPIVHHGEMVPQFKRAAERKVSWDDIAVGVSVFFVGLFKKAVLADPLAAYAVTPVFSAAAAGHELTFLEAWGGVLGYTLQLYFDFSGYCDMAIGAARLFGFKLPANFDSPYKSSSIIEFWRRWHMTLGRFLRNYLYIALGGNRRGQLRRYVNLFLTMLLGGLWHGAGWTFVIWGTLHGVYLAANHVWRDWCSSSGRRVLSIERFFATALTFIAVVVGWTFFRASSVAEATHILAAMSGQNGIVLPAAVARWLAIAPANANAFGSLRSATPLIWIALLLAWCWLLPNTQQIFARQSIVLDDSVTTPRARWLQFDYSIRWATAMAAAVLTCLLYVQSNLAQEFLYFDF